MKFVFIGVFIVLYSVMFSKAEKWEMKCCGIKATLCKVLSWGFCTMTPPTVVKGNLH